MARNATRRRQARIITLALLVTPVIAVAQGIAGASAYNRSAAISYSDAHALNPDTFWPVQGNDCTNFVSLSMAAGRYPAYTGPNGSLNSVSTFQWWMIKDWQGQAKYTITWINAHKLFLFLKNVAQDTYVGSEWGGTTNTATPGAMWNGDVLFYDWNSDGVMDHASFQAYLDAYTINYVNMHTTNRYHAIWHLRPWNTSYGNTTIHFIHITK